MSACCEAETICRAAIIGKLLGRFRRRVGGQLPLLVVAVGLDDLLVAANGVFVAQVEHLAEGIDRQLILVGFAIDRAQALQEDRAIVLVGTL